MPVYSYRNHLDSYEDLVTSYEKTRAAFVAQALEKTRLAVPYVAEARSIKAIASKAKTPKDLLNLNMDAALATAAGMSDKGQNHIPPEAVKDAISHLIEHYLEPAGPNFVEELVYRFLLTRGDTLGGSMRNLIGSIAKRQISRAILANLANIGYDDIMWIPIKGKSWNQLPSDNADVESMVKGICWGGRRTIIFDIKPKFINKNIDIILLKCDYSNVAESLEKPQKYLALGELKGGMDPAGADEHWKTASGALGRINSIFEFHHLNPSTFFVGAAIETDMAKEIYSQLEEGKLSNAANLTDTDQVASLSNWICSL